MSKLDTIKKTGIKPVLEGLKNKIAPNAETEKEAKRRAKICADCNLMELEPVPSLRIKDSKIPEVSKMMCGDCWCSIPLKIRQNISLCEKWN